MKLTHSSKPAYRIRAAVILLLLSNAATTALAQTRPNAPAPPAQPPSRQIDVAGAGALTGRTVEDIRILGNAQVSSAIILNLVRTKQGDPFDPLTVQEDYQRIYGLRKFSNVEAKVEPTASGGVIVAFVVTEQRQIKEVLVRGNFRIDELTIRNAIDVKPGESIDRFRIALAKQAIETLYRDKNYPFAHADVDADRLARTGELVFNIVEGPNVRVRNIRFIGNHAYTDSRLKDQIGTRTYIWIFRAGLFNPSQIEDDVAQVRRYYEGKGYFDVRVGRKIIFSPDNSEVQIDYIVEEGKRYVIEKVSFKGNGTVGEAQLRQDLKLVEGQYYDTEVLQRDVRQIVKTYSPFGFIYLQQSNDPEYLRIDPQPVFRREAGRVELAYNIREGRPFRMGRVIVKGNSKTQDKVILREVRVQPGQVYNSGELQDAQERIRNIPGLFTGVTVTPTGDDPEVRDVLVEVQEGRSATFNLGAGINSNGGVGANITYEQKNFDIANPPHSFGEMFTDKAFTGAGQTFRASFEPGTVQSNASLRFFDPYIFDQPYGFGAEGYLRNRIREDYVDTRFGGRLSLEKRFDYVYSARLSLRGEDVNIHDIRDEELRADEINDAAGHHTLTSAGILLRRDTSNRGVLPSRGTTTAIGWESYGALGGEYTFQKFTIGFDYYKTLSEDLLDRKTIFAFHTDAAYLTDDAPFFERNYGGGIGSVRGFAFRGISPRSGPDDDRVGGDFSITATAEISYPLYGETLRGVVFTDVGTVEEDVRISTIRSSVGTGIRLSLPFLGQVPVAIDVAIPLSKSGEDDTQFLSFSLGFQQ